MRRAATGRVVLASALAAVLIAGIAVAAAGMNRSDAAGGSEEGAPGRAASVLLILAKNKTPDDNLPAGTAEQEDDDPHAIDLDTTRLLMRDKTGSYYAAQDNSGNVCLFVSVPDGPSMGSCTSVEQFRKRGTGSTFQSPDAYMEAYLVPDGTSANSNTAGLAVPHRNLLVGDTRGLSETHLIQRLPTITGERVELQLLGIH